MPRKPAAPTSLEMAMAKEGIALPERPTTELGFEREAHAWAVSEATRCFRETIASVTGPGRMPYYLSAAEAPFPDAEAFADWWMDGDGVDAVSRRFGEERREIACAALRQELKALWTALPRALTEHEEWREA